MNIVLRLISILFISLLPTASMAVELRVIASIKPVHSLVSGVMAGVGAPELLVGGMASEHGYALRPSQAQSLENADLVFWVGPQLETFLIRPLAGRTPEVDQIALSGSPGVGLLALRDVELLAPLPPTGRGQAWDMHIWLDPDNADAMIREIAMRLEARDPEHANVYAKNAAAMEVRLAASRNLIRQRLAAAAMPPYIVYHDAYQYFEKRFGLLPAAIISLDPERQPGAGRVRALRNLVLDAKVACVFAEPQFEPQLIHTLTEGAQVRIATLDPLGSELAPGADLYFLLLDQIANAMTQCAPNK